MSVNKDLMIDRMTENLPLLRSKLGFTQEDLANKLDLSRGTIISIETRKRTMTWQTFLSLYLIFSSNSGTNILLQALEITNESFVEYLSK